MIENAVLIAQEDYAAVIGRSEGQLAICESMHYALVGLHIRIQTAVSYEMLGKRAEARKILERAIADGEPDRLYIPFVENYLSLRELLHSATQTDFTRQLIALGDAYLERRSGAGDTRPAALASLTAREFEIAGLMTERLSNREIAEKLFLSEGSVKQYVTKIYAKLGLTGDNRAKRSALCAIASGNTNQR